MFSAPLPVTVEGSVTVSVKVGDVIVGAVAKTNAPLPVSSLIAVASCALVPVIVFDPRAMALLVKFCIPLVVATSCAPPLLVVR
jgi:hypothetical protein